MSPPPVSLLAAHMHMYNILPGGEKIVIAPQSVSQLRSGRTDPASVSGACQSDSQLYATKREIAAFCVCMYFMLVQ